MSLNMKYIQKIINTSILTHSSEWVIQQNQHLMLDRHRYKLCRCHQTDCLTFCVHEESKNTSSDACCSWPALMFNSLHNIREGKRREPGLDWLELYTMYLQQPLKTHFMYWSCFKSRNVSPTIVFRLAGVIDRTATQHRCIDAVAFVPFPSIGS
jgi:hypothetical protein